MKKLITILSIGLFTINSYAQCAGELAQGCVGACGAPTTISYTVTAADVVKSSGGKYATICLSVLSNSLCPNTGAEATVKVGRKTMHVDLSNGRNTLIRAKAGDVITVNASLYSTMKEIYCIWLGELTFGLGLN
jgi:hypothetical protein